MVWLVRERRGWRRGAQSIEQISWTGAEIRRALRGAGFGRIAAFDGCRLLHTPELNHPGCKTFFPAQEA